MLSTIATEIKDISISPNGEDATFVPVTKYSGDISVTLPASCPQKLRVPSTSPSPTNATPAIEQTPEIDRTTNGVAVVVPKTWLAAADQQQGLIVVVLNHRISGQFGFALNTNAAVEFAAAITQQIETLTTSKPAKS